MGFNTSNSKLKILLNRFLAVKFLMFKSTVNQNAINDNNYSFDVLELTQNNWRESNFVGTIGNTIIKRVEWSICNGLRCS
jgi:hypothetical protein